MPKINGKEYTYEQAHRMLWNWLADNPSNSKYNFFESHEIDKTPHNYCYACETAKWIYGSNGDESCSNCPINWGKIKPFACEHCKYDDDFLENDEIALYEQWRRESQNVEKDLQKLSSLARQIAEIEWHDNTEFQRRDD
jgi:hypothetical protein